MYNVTNKPQLVTVVVGKVPIAGDNARVNLSQLLALELPPAC